MDKTYRDSKEKVLFNIIFFTFAKATKGGLAQLARALDWQSKGQGFDSPNLHSNDETVMKPKHSCLF